MVYAMLMEVTDSPDPTTFQKSDLYRRCMAAGILPNSEVDPVDREYSDQPSVTLPPSFDTGHERLNLQIKVEGMWCPACAWVIQTALERLDGIDAAVCDFASDRLNCQYDPVRVDPAAILSAIKRLGYRPSDDQGDERKFPVTGDFVRLMVCVLLSANVMMLSWSLYTGFFTSLSVTDIRYLSWPIVVMATGVMLYGGAPLFHKAWWGVRAGAPGMELLVCLGATSAYLFSLYHYSMGSWHLYFDTASMLITLVLLGKLLETKAKAKVRQDLDSFLGLQPKKVRLCNDRFPEGRFVALDQLAKGDRFRVKTDEIVPADGRVASGQGLVDESALTGESRPKSVYPGQSMTSGSRLIKGDVTVIARYVGDEALVGQMVAVILSGLSRQTPLESRTDRWLALFVPVMVLVAAVTVVVGHALGLAWEDAFVRGLTVLVVACPCALGIAIPLARIAGMSAAGQMGILVRDFEAFERAHRIDHVVLDKTGTLTHGQWSLAQVTVAEGEDTGELLAIAAGLEKGIDHAVARAVLTHVTKCGLSPAKVKDVCPADNGVTGTYLGREVKIGNWDYVVCGTQPEPTPLVTQTPLSEVFLSVDDKVCARMGFGDRVRDSAIGLMGQLKGRGFKDHLVSGDSHAATIALGQLVDIENVHGGLMPQDKADYVKRLQARSSRVAMLGDGINDAPALAMADLSVAVYRDASLAQQAADVTLMCGDPAQIIDFLNLAKKVNGKVVQNLGCAWIYNLISIPVAMSGFLNPLVAALAMLLSSLTVIGNTLLLVRKR